MATATSFIIIKASELEEFFNGSVQTRVESELCNHPSYFDPFAPAEDSYEVNYIEEHILVQDDAEEDNFGLVEVEVEADGKVNNITINKNGQKWVYRNRKYSHDNQEVKYNDMPRDIQIAFEVVEDAVNQAI